MRRTSTPVRRTSSPAPQGPAPHSRSPGRMGTSPRTPARRSEKAGIVVTRNPDAGAIVPAHARPVASVMDEGPITAYERAVRPGGAPRPAATTELSKQYMRRFVTNASTAAQPERNAFTGTHVTQSFRPDGPQDAKCAEMVGGRHVWVGNKDGTIVIYDAATGVEIDRTPPRDVICTALLEVGPHVWAGFTDGFVRVLDPLTQQPVVNFSRHTGAVTRLVAQECGRYVFSASDDFTVLQWNAADLCFAGKFVGHGCGVFGLCARIDRLFSGGSNGHIKVWDIYGKADNVTWRGHRGCVRFLVFTDGKLWSASDDATIRVWDNRGRAVDVLESPTGQGFTMLQAVGSTVWAASMGQVFIYDSPTRSLLGSRHEHEAHVTACVITGKAAVASLWTVGVDGECKAWQAETELRGDDQEWAEEIQRRGEEVVYLRDALQDLQEQGERLERRCDLRVADVEQELVRERHENDMRACQVTDLQAQLSEAQEALKDHAERRAAEDARRQAAESGERVNRVMAQHLQATEKKLFDAEERLQRFESDRSRLDAVADRRTQRDTQSVSDQAGQAVRLQQAEMRVRELERHTEELESREVVQVAEVDQLKLETVELSAKLDMSRKKLDEAQRIVAQTMSDLRTSQKDKQRLQQAQRSLQEAADAHDAAPEIEAPKPSSADAKKTDAPRRKGAGALPILPPKPYAERILGYVRSVCAAAAPKAADLPEPMLKALQYTAARRIDGSVDELTNDAADRYLDETKLGHDAPELRHCIEHGVDSLSPGQQNAMALAACRLYNPQWMGMTRPEQHQWWADAALFPTLQALLAEAEKTVAGFTTLPKPRKAAVALALQRAQLRERAEQFQDAPQWECDAAIEAGHVPVDLAAAVERTVRGGWRGLRLPQRRAIVGLAAAPYVPQWSTLRPSEQRDRLLRLFAAPTAEDVRTAVTHRMATGELGDTACDALAAEASVRVDAGRFEEMPLAKVVEMGRDLRARNQEPLDARHAAASGNFAALTEAQQDAVVADYVAQYDSGLDECPAKASRAALAATGPKLEIAAAEETATAAPAAAREATTAAVKGRCGDWDAMDREARMAWLAQYTVLPPLLALHGKISQQWPPPNVKELYDELCKALPRTVGREARANVLRRLEAEPFAALPAAEQQAVLREVFFQHLPQLHDGTPQPKTHSPAPQGVGLSAASDPTSPAGVHEQWMQSTGVYPGFEAAVPHMTDACAQGFDALPRNWRRALVACALPANELPMTEKYELADRFADQMVPELRRRLASGFAGLSHPQQSALHREFLAAFVADWGAMNEAAQTRWMRSRQLLSDGPLATLRALRAVAKDDSLQTPILDAILSRAVALGAQRRKSVTVSDEDDSDEAEDTSKATQFPPPARFERIPTPPAAATAARRPSDEPTQQQGSRRPSFATQAAPAAFTHTGDTVRTIAQRYSVDTAAVVAANPALRAHPLDAPLPDNLRLQLPPAARAPPTTLPDVARRYDIPAQLLAAANPSLAASAQSGTPLPPDATLRLPAGQVEQGDTLRAVAQRHNVSVVDLLMANPSVPGPDLPLMGQPVFLPIFAAPYAAAIAGSPHHPQAAAQAQAQAQPGQPQAQGSRRAPIVLPTDAPHDGSVQSPLSSSPPPADARPTLQEIARRTGRPVAAIAKLNPHLSPTSPVSSSEAIVLPPPPKGGVETLSGIAARCRIDPHVLHAANPTVATLNTPLPFDADVIIPAAQQPPPAYAQRGAAPGQTQRGMPLEAVPDFDTAPQPRAGVAPQPYAQQAAPAQAQSNQPHPESLAGLVERLRLPLGEVMAANPDVANPFDPVPQGQRLVLPSAPAAQQLQQQSAPPGAARESLGAVARRLSIPEAALLRQNPTVADPNAPLPQGYTVSVPPPSQVGPPQQESLAGMAARLRLDLPALQAANPAVADPYAPVPPRQQITLPSAPPPLHAPPPPTTVAGVAQRLGYDAQEVAALNGLRPDQALSPTQQLQLPPKPPAETLATIAERSHVPLHALVAANPQIRDPYAPLSPQQKVVLPPTTAAPGAPAHESLAAVAQRLNVRPEELQRANPALPRDVHAPLPPDASIVIPPAGHSRSRETIASVAQRLGMDPQALQRANPAYRSTSSPIEEAPLQLPPMAAAAPVGDSLAALAQRLFVPLDAMQRANPQVRDPYAPLPASTRVNVPSPNSTPQAQAPQETLAAVAQRLNIPVAPLLAANPHVKDPHAPLSRTVAVKLPDEAVAASRAVPPPPASPTDAASSHTWSPPPQTETLSAIARRVHVDPRELQAANPSVRDPDAPLPAGYMVRMPTSAAAARPETLASMASKLHCPVHELAAANPTIRDPEAPLPPTYAVVAPAPPRTVVQGEVRAESLQQVARRTGVDLRELQQANPHVRSVTAPLPADAAVTIPAGRSATSSPRPETLATVAARLQADPAELARVNPTVRGLYSPLPEGYVVALPPSIPPQAQPAGESLAGLAQRLAVPVQQLQQANPAIAHDVHAPIPTSHSVVLPAPGAAPAASAPAPYGAPPSHAAAYGGSSPPPQYQGQQQPQHFAAQPQQPYGQYQQYQQAQHSGHYQQPPQTQQPPQAQQQPLKNVQVYRAAGGESVPQLAAQLGVSEQALVQLNPDLRHLAEVPAAHHVLLPDAATDPNTATVAPQGETLIEVSRRHGVPAEAVKAANPGIAPTGLLPAGTRVALPAVSADDAVGVHAARVHRVAHDGETAESVAHRFNVPLETLVAENAHLSARGALPRGTVVFVPDAPRQAQQQYGAGAAAMDSHTVSRGETVASVAHRYGVPAPLLVEANPSLRGRHDAPLVAGRELVIPQPPGPVTAHTVHAAGETLHDVARAYGVDIDAVERANPDVAGSYTPLPAGRTVHLPAPRRDAPARHVDVTGAPVAQQQRAVLHIAEAGDTAESVARRYGVPEEHVRRFNAGLRSAEDTLVPGQRLVIPPPPDAAAVKAAARRQVQVRIPPAGASVESVAHRYGCTAESLRLHNGIPSSTASLPGGAVVALPPPEPFSWDAVQAGDAPRAGATAALSPAAAPLYTVHETAAGDTVHGLAYRYGVTPQIITACNPDLAADGAGRIVPGQRIVVVSDDPVLAHATVHTMAHGESLADVAQRYGVDEATLRHANPTGVQAGARLAVPPSRDNQQLALYNARGGETLGDVAQRYGVDPMSVALANSHTAGVSAAIAAGDPRALSMVPLRPGSTLLLPKPKESHAHGLESVFYADTQAGTSLDAVAYRVGNGATPDALQRCNQGNTQVGSRVLLPAAQTHGAAPPQRLRGNVAALQRYQPHQGESLDSIADRFGVPVDVVVQLNPEVPRYAPGSRTVLLPTDASATPAAAGRPRAVNSGAATPQPADAQDFVQAQESEAAREARAELERLIDEQSSAHGADTSLLGERLQTVLAAFEAQGGDVAAATLRANQLEARCRAAETALNSGSDGNALRKTVAQLHGELGAARVTHQDQQRRMREQFARELNQRSRAAARAEREAAMRAVGDAEAAQATQRMNNVAGAAGAGVGSRGRAGEGGPGGAHHGSSGGAVVAAGGATKGGALESVTPFLEYKDQENARLLQKLRALETENATLAAKAKSMAEKMHGLTHAVDSRPSLLKVLMDLFQMATNVAKDVDALGSRLNARDLGKRVTLQELGGIEAGLQDVRRGHRWVIGNMFTDVEILHLGLSPAAFEDTLDVPNDPAPPTPRRIRDTSTTGTATPRRTGTPQRTATPTRRDPARR